MAPDTPAGGSSDAGPGPGPGRHILLVDDDSLGRKLAALRLHFAGFDVTPAGSGEEALEVVRLHTFDAVVCDVRMTGMTGFDVHAALAADQRLARLPFFLLSSAFDAGEEQQAAAAGIPCLLRSADMEDLILALASALHREG